MNGYYVSVDQWAQAVSKFNGGNVSPTQTVTAFAAANGLTRWTETSGDPGDYGGENYYALSSPNAFSIVINGQALSAQIFTGRPPIIIRPI